jgi:hypothetical protein
MNRCTILSLAAAVWVLPSAASPQKSLGPRRIPEDLGLARTEDANDWLHAAINHRPGTLTEPERRIASWPEDRLLDVLRELKRVKPHTEALNDALAAGAMLHADISLIRRQHGGPDPPEGWKPWGIGLLTMDGRTIGRAELDGQIFFGRRLLAEMRPPAPLPGQSAIDTAGSQRSREWYEQRARDPRVRLFYRAIAADFAARYWLADLVPHLQAAREMLPDDPGVLFDSACLAETLAAPRVQAALPRGVRLSQSDTQPLSAELGHVNMKVGFNLSEAERYYRSVLEREPRAPEAVVRLAFVLMKRGRPRDAADLIDMDLHTSDATVIYYWRLVGGAAFELTGQFEKANTFLGHAASLFPAAQTPLVALGRLARLRGDDRGALIASEKLAALPLSDAARQDPWWSYYMCNGRNADEELRQVRDTFSRSGEK